MQCIDVTPAVWSRLLAVRAGTGCLCCGTWSDAERQALDLYGPMVGGRDNPAIVAQIGQSLDGRIATPSGDAQDVSGADGLQHLHRLRALVDGVVVGVKTALQDDPQLTVRLVKGNNPARVVIDPAGRLPDTSRVLTDTSARRIIVQAVDRARAADIEVVTLPRTDWICASDIVTALRGLGLKNLLIEGGGVTIAQFLEEGLLDHLHVAIAPLLIGAGPQGLSLRPVASLAQARRPQTRTFDLGSDVLFDCAFSERKSTPPCQHSMRH